ncbi:MAG: SDR family oxidoreductase, partial [Deltaproteobacteria bacterium]
HIPAGRLGTVREVAAAVVFLLTPAARFITGTVLRVDGGEPLLGSAAGALWRRQVRWRPFPAYE